jgi:hypothetical protein
MENLYASCPGDDRTIGICASPDGQYVSCPGADGQFHPQPNDEERVIDALADHYGYEQNASELKNNYDCASKNLLPIVGSDTASVFLEFFNDPLFDFEFNECPAEGTRPAVGVPAIRETVRVWLEIFTKMAGSSPPKLSDMLHEGTCIWQWVQSHAPPGSSLGEVEQWRGVGGFDNNSCSSQA